MHWVVRQDSGIKTIRDLEGKRFIPGGIGTATERLTKLVLKVYGLEGKVDLPAVDLKEGVDAVANRRAVGFSTGSPFPTPMVMELVATTPIRLLEIGDAEYTKLAEIDPTYSPTVIPTDTYKGVTGDTRTVASPVLMYTTDDLSDDLAYKLTKAFWDHRKMIADAHATGKGLDITGVRYGVAKVHPGPSGTTKRSGSRSRLRCGRRTRLHAEGCRPAPSALLSPAGPDMYSTLRSVIAFSCSLGLALFALLLPVYAFVPNLIERALHVGLAIPLIFLTSRQAGGRTTRWLDAAFDRARPVPVRLHHRQLPGGAGSIRRGDRRRGRRSWGCSWSSSYWRPPAG